MQIVPAVERAKVPIELKVPSSLAMENVGTAPEVWLPHTIARSMENFRRGNPPG